MHAPEPLPSPQGENDSFLRSTERDDFLIQLHESLKMQRYQWELQWNEVSQQEVWLVQRQDWLDQQEDWLELWRSWLVQRRDWLRQHESWSADQQAWLSQQEAWVNHHLSFLMSDKEGFSPHLQLGLYMK